MFVELGRSENVAAVLGTEPSPKPKRWHAFLLPPALSPTSRDDLDHKWPKRAGAFEQGLSFLLAEDVRKLVGK